MLYYGTVTTFKTRYLTEYYFARIFDGRNRLVLTGRYQHGQRVGKWWHKFPGNGGHLLTRVVSGSGGLFEDDEAVYVYPDFQTCLVGRFVNGVMAATACQAEIKGWRLLCGLPDLDVDK